MQRRFRLVRSVGFATIVAAALALVSVATALADNTPFPH